TVGGPSIKISDAPPVKIGSPDPLTAQFSVTLSAPATSIVSVNYTTKPGTALAGTDFTSKSGTITFQPGQTAATIQVPVTQQFITQDKAFTVELSNATSAGSAVTIDDSSGQALIDAPEYDLVFTFRQQQVGGVTKAGTITGQIFNHGELVTNLASMTGRASVDDAFPLKNLVFENVKGGAPAANQSRNFEKYPLTFDLKNFQPNPDQTAVIMHLGTFNNPKYTQFPSWASQSCLVVEQQFLDALQSNLSKLAGQTFTAKNVAAEVAWINRYVDVKFDVQTTLTQAKLSVDAPTIVNRVVSGGINPNATFEFDLSRSIEKDVLVLYSVTNEDTGATVVRTSLVSAFSTSSADISFSSLFGSAKPPKGAADALKIFSDAKGEIPLNKTTYNKSLPWNPADSYAIEIEAYAVSYQNGKEWYFDSRLSGMKGPADFSKQTLMFSNDLTAEFEFAQTPARSASMAALLEGDMFPFSDTSATPERASDIADLWLV
ncbi:MAG: Calx-beta domain-containing protein, partial [Pseudorhodoplanes sp.]